MHCIFMYHMYVCTLYVKRERVLLCPQNQFSPLCWKLGAGSFTYIENAQIQDFSVFSLSKGKEGEHCGLRHCGYTIPSSQDPQQSLGTKHYILQALTINGEYKFSYRQG